SSAGGPGRIDATSISSGFTKSDFGAVDWLADGAAGVITGMSAQTDMAGTANIIAVNTIARRAHFHRIRSMFAPALIVARWRPRIQYCRVTPSHKSGGTDHDAGKPRTTIGTAAQVRRRPRAGDHAIVEAKDAARLA